MQCYMLFGGIPFYLSLLKPRGVSQGIHSSIVHSQLISRHLFANLI
ncbi:MAG: hypothetical protein SPG50_03730 [Muribaculaceae bacterium]|nr:hypothetical protein [Muribaculaceae bacterium]